MKTKKICLIAPILQRENLPSGPLLLGNDFVGDHINRHKTVLEHTAGKLVPFGILRRKILGNLRHSSGQFTNFKQRISDLAKKARLRYGDGRKPTRFTGFVPAVSGYHAVVGFAHYAARSFFMHQFIFEIMADGYFRAICRCLRRR